MNLKGILSISGYPGLFKLISQMKGGVVVESLSDGKRMPAYTTHKILALEDISIYTDENDVPLSEVFALMLDRSNGKAVLDPKNASISELSDHLASVLPNYDRERVYNSDLKKLFQWFNLLVESGLLTKEEEKQEEKSSSKKTAAPKSAKQEKTEAPKPKSEPKGKKGSTKKVKK